MHTTVIKKKFLLVVFPAIVCTFLISVPSIAKKKKTGILNLDTSPTGALVFIDGKMRGTTPMLLEIEADIHEIVIEQQGYRTYKSKIRIKNNKVFKTLIKLKRASQRQGISLKNDINIYTPGSNSEPGTVFLTTTPKKLVVYIDDYAISKPTPVAFDIKPGIYELTLKNHKSEVVYKKTIFIRSGKTLTLDVIIHKKRTIDYSDPWR